MGRCSLPERSGCGNATAPCGNSILAAPLPRGTRGTPAHGAGKPPSQPADKAKSSAYAGGPVNQARPVCGLVCGPSGGWGKTWRVSRPAAGLPPAFHCRSLGVFCLSVPFSSYFAGSSPAVFCPLPSGSGASAGGFAVACRVGRSSRVWWLVVASAGPSGVSFRWASARASRSLFASPAVAASAGSLAIWGGLGWPGGASSGRVRVVRCRSFGVPVPVWAGF